MKTSVFRLRRRLLGFAFVTTLTTAYAETYVITDLGVQTQYMDNVSRGTGINASGQAIGFSYNSTITTSTPPAHGFLYSDGVVTDLSNRQRIVPNDINAKGQIVGSLLRTDFNAILYDNGVITNLGTLGGLSSAAYAINDSGQITGHSRTSQFGPTHAFLYSNGVMRDLGTLGGMQSQGLGINASGQITGSSYLYGSTKRHAFLYSNGVMTGLGTLGGEESIGYGINDSGQITGSYSRKWCTA